MGVCKDDITFNDGGRASLMKVLTAEASAEVDWSYGVSGEFGGYAAIYSCNSAYVFDLGFCTANVEVELYFGSVSFCIEWDIAEGAGSLSPPTVGAGCKFGVDFDWK